MRKGARRKKTLIPALLLLAVAALGVYLVLFNMVFLVREVRVVGNESIDQETIIRQAQLPMGQRLSAIDEEEVRAALESSGLLELVSLEVNYPSEVVLNVRERAREAMVAYAGVVLILERDGTVVEQLSSIPDVEAVYVTGLDITSFRLGECVNASKDRLEVMSAALEGIFENDAQEYVSELNVSDVYNIYIYSRTGMRVQLGDGENMGNKIAWMVASLRDLEARGELTGTLDVSSSAKADYSAT